MRDIRNGFKNSETVQNLSNIRTPMTPDNKYKRIGLLMIGLACIVAGVIILIVSLNNSKQASDNGGVEQTVTTVAETVQTGQ